MAAEERTARLTILVDPRKKAMFEQLCAEEDSTPSQVLRRLMRRYIEERTGQTWSPSPPAAHASPDAIKKPRRVTAEKMENKSENRRELSSPRSATLHGS